MKSMWQAGDLIRSKETQKAYLVIQVQPEFCTLVLDPTQSFALLPLAVLMQRDYSKFAKDWEFKTVKQDIITGAVELKYKPIEIK